MSIEIVGPKKYFLQDLTCVLVAVLYAEAESATLTIETRGGEDAELEFLADGAVLHVEVQVKGAEGAVTLDTVAEWLAHFPPYALSGSLLERLVTDHQRIVLFTASGRCDDAASAYVVPFSDQVGRSAAGSLKKVHVAEMKAALYRWTAGGAGDDSLEDKRRAALKTYLDSLKERSLREALHQLLIVERSLEADVTGHAERLLLKKHQVVPDRLEETLRRIQKIVVDHKGTGKDILPLVRAAINVAKAQTSLRPHDYVRRGDEEALKARLTAEKALLLAGRPRVGKTSTARYVAADLQDQGFAVLVTSSVDAAQRFLLEPVDQPRVAVVDDPFGGAHSVPSALREMESLDRLICDLSVHRRIVVAQSVDRLSEVVRGASLAKLRTGGLAWVQLDPLSQQHLAEIWQGLCLRRKIPEGLASLVANALSAGDLTLEPGCLVHLAYNYESLPLDARLADVERLGLQNANSFGRALAAEGLTALLEALAVATTPQRPVHLTELAFVMGHGGPARPGESNVNGTMVSFGGGPPPSSPEPRYGPDPSLTEAELRALELLELRRIIEEIGTDTLGFSHSFYRAGAESLLDGATIAAGHRLVTHVERAIFSLSPVTASAAAANLHWLYSSSAERAPVRTALVEAAKAGLKSIFPVTRDACFAFLSSVLTSLPVKEQADVTHWVNAVTAFAASEVGWFRGEPRIPQANALSDVLELDLARPSPNDASVRAVVALLNSTDAGPITPQEAALALPHYESHPKELNAQAVSRLLSFDVGLIRAPAAAAWIRIPREEDEVILSRIFGDAHPAVVRAVYRSVVIAWWECDAARRELLRLGLLRLASSPTGAASLVDQMVLFGRAEFGELPPWELFGSLMPLVLEMLPAGTALHDARLYDVVRTASKHISVDALLSIADRWIEYLEALPSARTASDYLLGCTVVLVDGTNKSPHLREARLLKFLQLKGTATRIRVVADLTDLWQHLRGDERQELQRHLAAEAADSVWLSAAVLTREEVPEQLAETILPARFSLSEGPAAILSSLEPELVNACLLIYTCGHPTLYSVGAHGNRGEIWDPVVEAVALSPTHELFEVAWEHLAIGDDGASSARLIRALGTPNALRLFELMMSRKLRTTGDFMPKAWEALFEVAPDVSVRTEWLKRMALAAPRVLDGLFEVKQWIPQEYRNEFLAEFPGDLNVYKFLAQLDDASEIAPPPGHEVRAMLNDAMIKLLRKIIETTPPLHWATFEHAAAALRRHGIDDRGLLEELEQRRLAARPSYGGSPQPYIPELRNWVN